MLDLLRVVMIVFVATIFFAWAVIMTRSLIEYVRAKRAGKEASLRLHIWMVTGSYLILLTDLAWDMAENLGEPLEEDLPMSVPATVLGMAAIIMFLRQGRTTVRVGPADPPAATVGPIIVATVVVGLVAFASIVMVVLGR